MDRRRGPSGGLWWCVAVALFLAGAPPLSAQEACMEPESLVRLDAEWERALLERDAVRLNSLLADDFVWVHNHASAVDSKETLLRGASGPLPEGAPVTRSRTRSGVEARVLGRTGVVSGYTLVDRGPSPTTYHFMRTYVEVDGVCLLLANHTMEVPEG